MATAQRGGRVRACYAQLLNPRNKPRRCFQRPTSVLSSALQAGSHGVQRGCAVAFKHSARCLATTRAAIRQRRPGPCEPQCARRSRGCGGLCPPRWAATRTCRRTREPSRGVPRCTARGGVRSPGAARGARPCATAAAARRRAYRRLHPRSAPSRLVRRYVRVSGVLPAACTAWPDALTCCSGVLRSAATCPQRWGGAIGQEDGRSTGERSRRVRLASPLGDDMSALEQSIADNAVGRRCVVSHGANRSGRRCYW